MRTPASPDFPCRWRAGQSVGSGVAFLYNNVTAEDFVSVDALEPPKEIGAFACLGSFWCGRGREQRDDSTALADTNCFPFFNPVQNAAKIVPQLPNGCRFHV